MKEEIQQDIGALRDNFQNEVERLSTDMKSMGKLLRMINDKIDGKTP